MTNRAKTTAGALIPVVFALFVFKSAFGSGSLVFLDNPIHQAQLGLICSELLSNYHWLSGWSLGEFAGFDSLMYYPQLGFVLPTLLVKAGLGLGAACKFAVFSAMAFAVCALYTFAQPFAGRKAAVFASTLWLLTTSFINPILGGIWNFYLSAGFVFLLLRMVFQCRAKEKKYPVAVLGLVFAAIIFSHTYATVCAGVFLLGIMLFDRFKGWWEIALGAALGVGINAAYLYPVVASADYLVSRNMPYDPKKAVLYSLKSFFTTPFSNTPATVYNILPVLAGIVGIFSYVFYSRKNTAGTKRLFFDSTIFSTVMFLLLSTGLWKAVPALGFAKGIALDGFRTLALAQCGLWIFVGWFCCVCWQKAAGKISRAPMRAVVGILTLALAGGMFFAVVKQKQELVKLTTDTPAYASVEDLWGWMRQNIDPQTTRVLMQDTMGNAKDPLLRSSHALAQTYVKTGIATLGTWSGGTLLANEQLISTESGAFMGHAQASPSTAQMLSFLQSHNANFVVCCSEQLFFRLHRSKLFDIAYDNKDFVVFRLKPVFFNPSWVVKKRSSKTKLDTTAKLNPTRLSFQTDPTEGKTSCLVKFAFHPFWRAVDTKGERCVLKKGIYGLTTVFLPEDTTGFKLCFDPHTKKALPVTVGFLLAALFFSFRQLRKQKN